MTVVLDDHLLRDWLARRDDALVQALARESVATTNLWYARLCKSAARAPEGALLRGWGIAERRALISGLIALPDDIAVVPMHELAWTMGELVADFSGLSTLGAEAVAATRELDARLLVSARDDGPGIRQCCVDLGIGYETLDR
ncbi:MAG TPA: hypothetical protein VFF40_11870 [Acidimicrobiia bacterium]|nr:hypothetical protein [Acidimicrobiia bacterium]